MHLVSENIILMLFFRIFFDDFNVKNKIKFERNHFNDFSRKNLPSLSE
jgi:hypothetical protein